MAYRTTKRKALSPTKRKPARRCCSKLFWPGPTVRCSRLPRVLTQGHVRHCRDCPPPDTVRSPSYVASTREPGGPSHAEPNLPPPLEGPNAVPPGQLHRRQMGAVGQRQDDPREEPGHRRGDRRSPRIGRC